MKKRDNATTWKWAKSPEAYPAKAPAKAVKAQSAKGAKKTAKPKGKGEPNTDALEAPYRVGGKPNHYQY